MQIVFDEDIENETYIDVNFYADNEEQQTEEQPTEEQPTLPDCNYTEYLTLQYQMLNNIYQAQQKIYAVEVSALLIIVFVFTFLNRRHVK